MTRIIYGNVSAAGAKTGGVGFTSKRTTTGRYEITFGQAYSEAPAANVTLLGDGAPTGTCDNTVNLKISTTKLSVFITDLPTSSGQTEHTNTNNAFTFMVIGQ